MRTFVAIDLEKGIKDKLYDVQEQIKKLDLKATYPHKKNFDITLVFLDEKSDEEVCLISESLRKIKYSPFDIEIKNIGAFPNEIRINVVWAGVESDDIYRLDYSICKAINFKLDRPFHPHITICRVKTIKNIQKLRDFILKNKKTNFGTMKVRSFALKKSTLTKDGPIYETIEEFHLD